MDWFALILKLSHVVLAMILVMLVSTLIYAAASALVPTVFLPRGRAFERALEEARAAGSVTPALRDAFRDPQVRAARGFEMIGIAVIVALMVLKPF